MKKILGALKRFPQEIEELLGIIERNLSIIGKPILNVAEKMSNKRLYFVLLLAIVFVGMVIRLAFVPHGELWFDEAHSIFVAKLPLEKIPDYLSAEENPPLFYFLLHFWLKWFGDSDIVLRILPIPFGILAIIAIYFLGRMIFNSSSGLIAALFVALSPLQVWYSVEVRMYSLIMLLSLGSVYFFVKGFKRKRSIFWLFYIIFSLLGLYTHLAFSFLILAQNFYIFFLYFRNKEKPNLRNWAFIQLIIFIGYLPWFFIALKQLRTAFLYGLGYTMFFRSSSIIEQVLLNYLWFNFEMLDWFFSITILLGVFLNCFLRFIPSGKKLLTEKRKENFKINSFLLIYLFFPVLIFSLVDGAAFNIRHIIFSSAALYLILARGISNIKSKKIILIVLIFTSFLMLRQNFNFLEKKRNYIINQEIANYIQANEQPGDFILVTSSCFRHQFSRYYHGSLPVRGFLPGWGEKDQNSLEFAKKEIGLGGSIIVNEKNVNTVEDYVEPYKRVWLLQLDFPADPQQLTWQYLSSNWKLNFEHAKLFPTDISGPPTVSLFERLPKISD